jgi:hypothetical protein
LPLERLEQRVRLVQLARLVLPEWRVLLGCKAQQAQQARQEWPELQVIKAQQAQQARQVLGFRERLELPVLLERRV